MAAGENLLGGAVSEDEPVVTCNKDTKDLIPGSRPAFKYRPLNRDTREIRVIILQPSPTPTSEVVCDIYNVPLSYEYFALSYAWGDPLDIHPITLNDRILYVTANLEVALRHIRDTKKQIRLWVDAICINQDDVEERNHQVGHMREIYAGAQLVIAWIGPQLSDREEKAFALLQKLFERYKKDGCRETDSTSAWLAACVSPGIHDYSWLPLLEILERPWFSRVWVVQEVVVARKGTLRCGVLGMEYDDFLFAMQAVAIYRFKFMEAAQRDEEKTGYLTDTVRVKRLQQLFNRFGTVIDRTNRVTLSKLEREKAIPLPSSFYDVVRRYRGRQATDPRDKILALLGLADERLEEITKISPNYEEQPRSVFLRMARLHIETRQNLEPLFDCCGPERPDGFPSWMPHWNTRGGNPIVLRDLNSGEQHFKASGDSKLQIMTHPNSLILKLRGVLIDAIHDVGAPMEVPPGEILGNFGIFNAVFRSWASLIGLDSLLPHDEEHEQTLASEEALGSFKYVRGNTSKLDAFWRTALMGRRDSLDIHHAHNGFQKIIARAMETTGPELCEVQTNSGILMCCCNRRFFLTKQGYMGLSFPETRVGDLVCIFPGLEVPFLVRPDGEYYLLVGEAYVQGLMDGEAMRDLDDGLLHMQSFELH